MRKILKVSSIWTHRIDELLIFHLIKNNCNKEIVFTSPNNADLLFIGPYNLYSVSNKIFNFLKRKTLSAKINKNLDDIQSKTFFRKISPLKIYISHENKRYDEIKADFYITSDFGNSNPNHLRIPIWKEYIDWKNYGVTRESTIHSLRFGEFYNLKKLQEPQGFDFLKKPRNISLFSSHLNEPRFSMYKIFKNHFSIDGFGPYFNKKIKNHNESFFFKKDILKNYAFNLCPHDSIYPGYYGEKIPDAFLGKSLPISWADKNINKDFNEKSFINLIDCMSDESSYEEIIKLMKDDNFLKKYAQEPLILNTIDLNKEIKFAERIISLL
jgi:hypothetical protein